MPTSTQYMLLSLLPALAPHLQHIVTWGLYQTNKKAQLTKPRDAVEIRILGHSKAAKVTPFNSLPMVSYYRPIVTLCLKCSVFGIWRHIGRKLPKNLYPTLICHVPWGWPLANFSTSYILPECEIMELSLSCFRSAGHNTGCDRQTDGQTDGHVAVAKTALCIASCG